MATTDERLADDVEALKKLMILDLIGKGHSQTQIALVLGVNQTTVSRMFPKGALKSVKLKPEQL
jgi:predicted XRE-type DNA-binding protein